MSLGQSLNISLNSLKNNQYALTVVSHNIANVNTEGYTRKRVDFQESIVRGTGINDVYSKIKSLNGSTISGITDYLDESALKNINDATADSAYANELADAIGGMEDIIDSLGDNGLNALMNEFYKAAANLEQFPDDLTIRQQYVGAAQNVCDKFNEISGKLDIYQEEKLSQVQDSTETVNNILSNIADLNTAYVKSGKDTTILSDINSALNELSKYTNVTTTKNANGTINVMIGNTKVIQGGELKYNLQSKINDDNTVSMSLVSLDDENPVTIKGVENVIQKGSLGANLEFLNGTNKAYTNLKDISDAVNHVAIEFSNEINKLQTEDIDGTFPASITTVEGVNYLEKATTTMFVSKDGGAINAHNIKVNDDIMSNVFLVAAARINPDDYTAEELANDAWTKAVGNSTNATEITKIQNKRICDYGGNQDNCTVSDFLAGIGSKNGLDTSNLNKKAGVSQGILDKALEDYSNISGVNIDEELADMLKYQRAYEASAKVFSVVDNLYDVILGMV